ncbi:MAG TPA: ATPase, T2SS/T4P/T4SS family [Egibacteraceae bacterium]|nr:ATPase, T2SS/T4P/T4SS family [Egibacteraceae bacterium]
MTEAAEPQTIPDRRRLGELLLTAGVLSRDDLDRALQSARTGPDGRRERLGRTVVRLGLASEQDVARALAEQLGLAHFGGDILPMDEAVAHVIPAAIAQRHDVVATGRDPDGTLVVAFADPTNIVALDDVRLATGVRRIRRIVASRQAVQAAMRKVYGFDQQSAVELLDSLETVTDEPSDIELLRAVEDAPVVRLADGILSGALQAGASDVHVEPGVAGTSVRYRIDGVLRPVMTVPRAATPALVSRLKLMAGMDIAERRRPQDGRSRLRGQGEDVDLRVATLPSLYGETVVMRLLRKGDERLTLSELGLSPEQLAAVQSAIERPQGLVLLTGPTGSGKTSTLYAFLEHLRNDTRKIITLEDPVEYQLDGISQTQISDQIGLTFARALRTVLRQDPDIVMVGEVRDPETAELALQASLTGHLVFSTLHTNDAAGAIVRLRDLGIPPYLIASSLTLVVAQRLARTICPACAAPRPPTDWQMGELHLAPQEVQRAGFAAGGGCAACGHSGYRGRGGVFEVLVVDATVRRLVAEGASEPAIRRAARSAGMRSLREDGVRRAMAGETTLEEVLRVTPSEGGVEGVCPVCAQEVEPDFHRCPWCSADLRPNDCVTCGRQLARGWVVCPECGTPRNPVGLDAERLPKLLVVDDDKSVRAAITAMLTGDYEVVEAADGEEALRLVHSAAPDAVLCDVSMPGMDGYTVTRELRSRPVTMHLPVVLMTGQDDRDTEIEGLRSGADDHLSKPLDPEVLLARLEAVLRRRTRTAGDL